MKKIFYNNIDRFIKGMIYIILFLNCLIFFSVKLLANENNILIVETSGRAVIYQNDIEKAKKRALDEALYLASLRGGVKVDGFSSIDERTNLQENLLVRPSSQIVDFSVIDESNDDTHYNIKIQAAIFHGPENIECNIDKEINLSFLKPKFNVSSDLPAWSNFMPHIVAQSIFENLLQLDKINVQNMSKYDIDVNKARKINPKLDYESLIEDSLVIKNGEYSVMPLINLEYSRSRIHRFSNEIIFKINLNLHKGPQFEFIDSFDYIFSLNLGNETGYRRLDAFYKTSKEKIIELMKLSLSRYHFRLADKLYCMPLESEVVFKNNQILVELGTNQGLTNGKVGLVSSTKNMNYSATDWSVLTVVMSDENYSILEPLNSKIDGSQLEGKIIRFMN